MKRRLWNGEFSEGRWNCLEKSNDENVHLQVEKYANRGSILDLGCGTGITGIELDPTAYSFYTGVDVADVAILRARDRARETGRAHCHEYQQSDILSYIPQRQYDVILYGDSIYYVPISRIPGMLGRYSKYLTEGGVFVVRMFDATGKGDRILRTVEQHFDVVEKHIYAKETKVCVMVFRPLVEKDPGGIGS